jgi:multiple sugar transport system substrate-binding protein
MHTNELLKYADNGISADLSDLYKDESATYYQDHFSEVSISNTQGSDGKIYGVPKDKDTVGLIYNKGMFDAAGISYPDNKWTWDDLVEASEKIIAIPTVCKVTVILNNIVVNVAIFIHIIY